MNGPGEQRSHGIGATLKEARRRAGIDVKTAEERTKIRARYLRALEAEDWEALPGPAYVRGFLRTYGACLGIDGEALADEYRRRHGSEEDAPASLASESMLRERRRGAAARAPLIVAIAAAVIILLVVLGSIGDDDGGGGGGSGGGSGGRGAATRKLDDEVRDGGGRNKPLKPVGLTLEPLDAVRVCLVGDGKEALIDGQMLAAGAEQSYDGFKRYRLDLADGGRVKLRSGGDSKRIDAGGKSSFEADSRGIRRVSYAGPECP